MIDPITNVLSHTIGALFVNDSDIYTWDFNLKTRHDVLQQHQEELYQWTLLLNVTGGALSPTKCFSYILDYECEEGEWSCTKLANVEITIPIPYGTQTKIKLEELDTYKKTLGVWDSPLGGNK